MIGLRGRPEPIPALRRPCPLCGGGWTRGSAGGPVGATADAPRPVRCDRCGLVFVDPLPAAALSPSTYGADYYEPWQGREERPRVRLWKMRLRQVERRADRGSLLDVGCGDGLFLSVARDAGWMVGGIGFSPEGGRGAGILRGPTVPAGDLLRGG